MSSHPGKLLCDDMMQMRIKQVMDAGLGIGRGAVDIADVGSGTFQAIVEGHGDYILITVYGGWGTTHQGVALTETPCHYGGARKWFICPSCRRRCGVLYIHQRIACRSCHDLAYASQYEPAQDRMLRQLIKIRKAIGCNDDIYGPFNPPPRGMPTKRWRAMIEEFKVLREKYFHEGGRPRRWRNDAPKAAHWRIGMRVPSSRLN